MGGYTVGDNRYYPFDGDKYPIAFKIFYGDHSIYESGIGDKIQLKADWDDAPKENVQVVVLYENMTINNNHTKVLYSGFDYYTFNGEKFVFTNENPEETILYGKWAIDYDTFREIFSNAFSEEL